jgi:group I intron endonuclease
MQTTAIQLKPYGYIYKVTNNFNGKCYIGQSINRPEKSRWLRYKHLNCIGQYKLYNTLKKNGPDNFTYEIIATGFSKDNLDFLEDTYEICYDSIDNGYNHKRGGANGKHSEETKRKMSKAKKGRKLSKEHIESLKGRIVSEDTRKKISLIRMGMPRSEETKMKLRGLVHTEETRAKISKANMGRKLSDETKEKIRSARLGMKVSLETIAKQRAKQLGVKISDATKEKIRNTLLMRYRKINH